MLSTAILLIRKHVIPNSRSTLKPLIWATRIKAEQSNRQKQLTFNTSKSIRKDGKLAFLQKMFIVKHFVLLLLNLGVICFLFAQILFRASDKIQSLQEELCEFLFNGRLLKHGDDVRALLHMIERLEEEEENNDGLCDKLMTIKRNVSKYLGYDDFNKFKQELENRLVKLDKMDSQFKNPHNNMHKGNN